MKTTKRRRGVAWHLSAVILASCAVASAPRHAGAEGINLSWDDCGVYGTEFKTFACDVNTGVDAFVGSFKPPDGITEFLGVSVSLRFEFDQLTDWWRHGTGQCRGTTGLATTFDFTTYVYCFDPFVGAGSGGFLYEVEAYGPNTARLRIQAAVPFENRGPLSSENEHYAFRVNLLHSKATGAGHCAGCLEPARIRLEEIQLFQPPELGFDPRLTTPISRTEIQWQGESPPPLPIQFTPTAGPPGTPVTLSAPSGLSQATQVRFDLKSAAFTIVTDSEIQTIAPADVRTGPIHVLTPSGLLSSTSDFIGPPHVTSLNPMGGPIGTSVAISGYNLTATSAVLFNGASSDFEIVSDVLILATVPPAATSGPITVVNPAGVDDSNVDFVIGPLVPGEGGSISLRWTECDNASPDIAFACNTNTGSNTAVASFVPPPGIVEFLGLSAEMMIGSHASSTLPDWWQHGTGLCRGTTGLATNFDFTASNGSCADFYLGQAAGGFAYDVGYGAPNRARLRVQCAVPFENRGVVDPGVEYYGFKVNLLRSKTTGTGACAGCAEPVSLTLGHIQLFQPPERNNDPVVILPSSPGGNVIHWQGRGTPVLASVVVAEATPDRVRLVWQTQDVDHATIHRREAQGEWRQIASLYPDGVGRVSYEDTDVLPGATYDYRLGVPVSSGGDVFVGETQVRVPTAAAAVLELSRVAWDPSAGALAMHLSLPSAGTASFELFDVNGRRLFGEHFEGLEAGTQDVQVRPAAPLRPGVYFGRVTQNEKAASRRFVVFQ